MAGQLTPLFLGLSLLLLCSLHECSPAAPTCSRISAAFYFDYDMFFIIGGKVVRLNDLQEVVSETDVSRFHFGLPITAAFGYDDEFFLISDLQDAGFSDIGVNSEGRPAFISYADLATAFKDDASFNGKIGAAYESYPDSTINVFSGCYYVSLDDETPSDVSSLKKNSDIGLPCDVDAILYTALTQANVAIKGNQLWLQEVDTGPFQGPIAVTDLLYGLEDYNFCSN